MPKASPHVLTSAASTGTGHPERAWYSDLIDLTREQAVVVVAPTHMRMYCSLIGFEIKETTGDGAPPTASVGNNPDSFDNIAAAQAPVELINQPIETSVLLECRTLRMFVDLTNTGLVFSIRQRAAATKLIGRAFAVGWLLPV